MSAYKQLNSQDLIVSPFEVNKGFNFTGGNTLTGSDVGIARYLGKSGNYLESSSLMTGTISSSMLPAVLVYDSIKQLYYGNYISGSGGFSGDAVTASVVIGADEAGNRLIGPFETTNFYDYPQTTLWANRDFPTASAASASISIGVISIPSKLWGDYIQPKSFLFEGPSGSIKDDGEGRLLWKHNNTPITSYEYMGGNIIYQHGIITLFDSITTGRDNNSTYGKAVYGTQLYGGGVVKREDFINAFITSSNVTMSFSSSYKLFETQYQITITEDEFNYSTNPTIVTGSTSQSPILNPNPSATSSYGSLLDFATGSYFEPYITTVGLYDNNFNLLAVGKLGKPLQTSAITDTTILVNIDR